MKNITDSSSSSVSFSTDIIGKGIKTSYIPSKDDQVITLSKLSPQEKTRLDELEKDVDDNLDAFTNLVEALINIKTEKLYRETHTSFDVYMREKWGFTSVHANRLIRAGETKAILEMEPVGSVSIPKSESACRPMSALPKEQVIEAGQNLKADGKDNPTAKEVEAVVQKVTGKKPVKKPVHKNYKKERGLTEDEELIQLVVMPGKDMCQLLGAAMEAIDCVEYGLSKEQLLGFLNEIKAISEYFQEQFFTQEFLDDCELIPIN